MHPRHALLSSVFQVTQGAEKLAKAEAEVERLRSIVSHMENEKNEQERHIRELQEQVKESNKKMASLKRSHQAEKKKTAQMLEEVSGVCVPNRFIFDT